MSSSKTVLITGSEGQLGSAYIKRLLELNYKVIGFDLLAQTKNSGIAYFRVDIGKRKEIEKVLDELKRQDISIDILINNAGVQIFTPFEERTEEELNSTIDVNLKGAIFMVQQVFNKFFKPRKQGCIVNVGSMYGLVSSDMRLYKKGDRFKNVQG